MSLERDESVLQRLVSAGLLSVGQARQALSGAEPGEALLRLVTSRQLSIEHLLRAQESVGLGPRRELPRLERGDVFGTFIITRRLGEGGMGAVYGARGRGDLDREVALKVIASQDERAIKRFEREALALARFSGDPNIVSIARIEVIAGRPTIVMELVPGPDLDARLAQGPLSLDASLELAAKIAKALQRVHDAGLLHRDLKPSNILLRDGTEPVITDFGLARSEDWETLTRSEDVLGTPHFMPPEQLMGGGAHLTPAADLWSLGAILYVLMTGERPFACDSLPGLVAEILHATPADPRSLNPSLPRGIIAVLRRLLDKDPRHRYPSAALLAEDLERIREGQPPTHSGSLAQALRRRTRGKGLWLALAGLLAVAVASLAGISSPGSSMTLECEARAAARDNAARAILEARDELLARALTEVVTGPLAGISADSRLAKWASASEEWRAVAATAGSAEEAAVIGSYEVGSRGRGWSRAAALARSLEASAEAPDASAWESPWREAIVGVAALRRGEPEVAAQAFEVVDAAPGFAALAPLARAALRVKQGRGVEALAALDDLVAPLPSELRSALLRALEGHLIEALTRDITRGAGEATVREGIERLRALGEPGRQRLDAALAARLTELSEGDDDAALVVASRGVRRWGQIIALAPPHLSAAAHARAQRAAEAEGDFESSLYHALRAREGGTEADLEPRYQALEADVIVFNMGFRGERAERLLERLLCYGRAGVFVSVVNRETSAELVRRGLMEEERKRAPADPIVAYWLACGLEGYQPFIKGGVEEAIQQSDRALALWQEIAEDPRLPQVYRAEAHHRWARAEELSFEYRGEALPEERVDELVRRIERALELGTVRPGRVLNKLARLLAVRRGAAAAAPVARRSLEWLERIRAKSTAHELGLGRPPGAPFEPLVPDDYQEEVREIHEYMAVAYGEARRFDEAFEEVDLAARAERRAAQWPLILRLSEASGRIAEAEARLEAYRDVLREGEGEAGLERLRKAGR